MDYETKPLSRNEIRKLVPYYRKLFGVSASGPFPVLEALEKIPDVFKGSNYEIVEDDELKPNVMAQCSPNDSEGFTIKIKESIYAGAYERGVSAFLGFINHEICHIFLFNIGFTPVYERSFGNNIIPAYRSVEWQAKALNGEVMIPYEECKRMPKEMIIKKYHVSKSFADYFDMRIRKGCDVICAY